MDSNSHQIEVRRGRPPGSGRTPLTRTERKARNAYYERRRRQDESDAMAELAAAVGCDKAASKGDILNKVIRLLKRNAGKEDLKELRRVNDLMRQKIFEIRQRIEDFDCRGADVEDSEK